MDKRKLIVHKYGTHSNIAPAHAALKSDLSHANAAPPTSPDLQTLEECTDIYDDTEVSLPFSSVALSSFPHPGRDLCDFSVVNSAYSINLTVCRGDFVTFEPPSGTSRIGGVGIDVKNSDTIRLAIPFVFGHVIHRTIPALFTPDLFIGLLNALDVSLVLVGCSHTTAAISFLYQTLTSACSWFPRDWAC
jgi:hypothetical protein